MSFSWDAWTVKTSGYATKTVLWIPSNHGQIMPGKYGRGGGKMSDEMMSGMWGFLFCLPAAVVLFFWYLHDEKIRRRRK